MRSLRASGKIVGSPASIKQLAHECNLQFPLSLSQFIVARCSLHFVGMAKGVLWYTVRHADGTWQPFTDVTGQTQSPGAFLVVDCAGVGGDLHVCGTTQGDIFSSNELWHTIRHADGSWQHFSKVKAVAGDVGSFTDVGCTEVNGELHLCGVTSDGQLWHTIRHADGSWQHFSKVKAVAGDIGDVQYCDCAGVKGELHVSSSNSYGSSPLSLWHTIRHADGSWQSFFNLTEAVANAGAIAKEVECAEVGDELHLVVNFAHGFLIQPDLRHTVRHADSTWESFSYVPNADNDIPVEYGVGFSVGESNGEFHLVRPSLQGTFPLLHTVRHADGTWQAFDRVDHEGGAFGVDGLLPL